MYNLLKRTWIPLLIVIVIVIAGLTVARIRTFFGSNDTTGISNAAADDTKPFNPKIVKYEIYGVNGATATSTTSTSTHNRNGWTAPRCRGR